MYRNKSITDLKDRFNIKEDRKKSDITGDLVTHFFELILKNCFSDQDCILSPPDDSHCGEFPEDEKGNWDPNHPSVFENERSSLWLRGT